MSEPDWVVERDWTLCQAASGLVLSPVNVTARKSGCGLGDDHQTRVRVISLSRADASKAIARGAGIRSYLPTGTGGTMAEPADSPSGAARQH